MSSVLWARPTSSRSRAPSDWLHITSLLKICQEERGGGGCVAGERTGRSRSANCHHKRAPDGWTVSSNNGLIVFPLASQRSGTTHHHQQHRGAKVHKQRGTEAALNRRWQSKQMRGINGAAVFYFAKYPLFIHAVGEKNNNKATQLAKRSLKIKSSVSQWANYKWSAKRDGEKSRAGAGEKGEVRWGRSICQWKVVVGRNEAAQPSGDWPPAAKQRDGCGGGLGRGATKIFR